MNPFCQMRLLAKDPAEVHNLASSEDVRDVMEHLRITLEQQLAADGVR
jgi:hypothetical protein